MTESDAAGSGANAAVAAPVIAIDGPTASGKGEIARRIARRLGWHYLDSGALYRVTALAALRAGIALDDEAGLAALARDLPVSFAGDQILLGGQDVGDEIRRQEIGSAASRIATIGPVREALGALQRGFRRWPGLVADGRDMGTVVFPSAPLKIFLTASALERAERRYKQLIAKGENVSLPRLLQDIEERDERDSSRDVAPLVPAEDAIVIDSTATSIEDVFAQVMQKVKERGLIPA